MDSCHRNSSPSDPMESICRHFPPLLNYTLLYIYQISRELTSGESGCSWPSSIGLSLGVLDNPLVDARSGYWNIQLDHESSLYTTFNSPHGRYRFLRLPFGLICAQDIFQKKVDETFGDLPGVTGIADDIIVYGYEDDGSDHDKNLQAVMSRARETGLRFNADKCKIRCTELPFFGHIISANDLRPDPRKVEAIANMDPSTCLADLQTFLGMTQFLSRFIPNLASVSATLWDLTKKSSDFQWGPEHESAVQQSKGLVASPNSLQYFDSSKPVTIQVDTSQRGLGAALIQDKGPVEYRCKLLTETETPTSSGKC